MEMPLRSFAIEIFIEITHRTLEKRMVSSLLCDLLNMDIIFFKVSGRDKKVPRTDHILLGN